MHPDIGWVYIGKTNDLYNRINTHDNSKFDNIDRKYAQLLKESSVYYLELNGDNQIDYVEKYLIDKYKPFLNKKDKKEIECCIEMKLPSWKKYIRHSDLELCSHEVSAKLSKEKNNMLNLIKETAGVQENIALLKNINQEYTEGMNKKISQEKTYSVYDKSKQVHANNLKNYKIKYEDIESFYEFYEDSDIYFSLKYYDEGFHEYTIEFKREGYSIDDREFIYGKDGYKSMNWSFAYDIYSEIIHCTPSSLSYFYLMFLYYKEEIIRLKSELLKNKKESELEHDKLDLEHRKNKCIYFKNICDELNILDCSF